MRFFREVELAPICYVREAIDWIVLGAAPEFSPDDTGVEIRGNFSAFLNDFHLAEEPLTPLELKQFGSTLGYEDYIDALFGRNLGVDLPLSQPVTDEALKNWQSLYNQLIAKQEEEQRAKLRADLFLYEHEVDRAKAKIMAALVEGRINIKGYWAENDEAFYELQNSEEWPQPELIPPEVISPTAYEWSEHLLKTSPNPRLGRPAGAYYLVTMTTSEMLKTFSAPLGSVTTLRLVNGNAVLDGAEMAEGMSTARPRGRPPKTDWIRDAMRSWYQAQCARGTLGRGKVEADLQAAMDWATQAGVPLARSTVQSYLRGLLG